MHPPQQQQQHYEEEYVAGNTLEKSNHYILPDFKQRLKNPSSKDAWKNFTQKLDQCFNNTTLSEQILNMSDPDLINDTICSAIYDIQGSACGLKSPSQQNPSLIFDQTAR